MSNTTKRTFSRRRFLGTSAAAAAAFSIVPRYVLGGAKFVPPSEKVNIAIIGAGGQGRHNMGALFNEPDAQVIAVCDVAEETDLSKFYYGGKGGRGTLIGMVEKKYAEKTPNYKCAGYVDFRDLLAKEKAVDAILCATPDHNHGIVSITAMKLGKHVYCEKPLGHNIWEVRQMAKVAKETGVATQMGNHGHSGEGIRQTCEWIWDGAIGKITEVYGWSGAAGWSKGPGRPKETPPVPANLNWDLWLGVRPERPYSPAYAPYNWRGWWEFGTGCFGDMACHNIDPAVWALKLEHATSVEAKGQPVDSEVVPQKATFTFQFPARGDMPPVKLTWFSGGEEPPAPPGVDAKDTKQRLGDGGNGILFIGEKGYITCAGWAGMPRLLPLERHREYKRPEPTLRRTKGHHADWISAIKGGEPASGNFEYSAKLTEIILLGNVAFRLQKKLNWDGPNMKASNAPEAQKYVKEIYRKGWEIA
ncbi:MAG: Gfo/Idh/MocA family protein [Tepidisphaerales bacterium]